MSTPANAPSALIVGASRGLGLALALEYAKRGWHVVATVRGSTRGALHEAADASHGQIEVEHVDIAIDEQIAALRQRLHGRRFDLLFVNAGVANDPQQQVGDVSSDEFMRVMQTNTLGPMRVISACEDLVTERGTIGVMSSGLGSVADNESGGWEVYRASKAALNTLMRSYAARDPSSPRAVLIVAPGWVRTDMGGPAATLGVEDSIPKVVDTITRYADKPGAHYVDYRGQVLRW